MNRLIDHLRRLVEQPLGDADLLDCFIERREDTAFVALLKRHGPMVLGVCGSQPSRHSVSITASHLTAFIFIKSHSLTDIWKRDTPAC